MQLNNCVQAFLSTLKDSMMRPLGHPETMEFCPVEGYKTNNTPPTAGWQPFSQDTALLGSDTHYWIRSSFHTPALSHREYVILRTLTGREGWWDATNPQCILYLNGKMAQGLDTNHTDTILEADTDYTLHNYFYMGSSPTRIHCSMTLYAVDRHVEQLYYDVQVPFEVCQLTPHESEDYIRTMSVLVDATRLVDFRDPNSPSFHDSVDRAIRFMEEEFYSKLCSTQGKPVVHCVGHTHIDVEWQWTRAQTREKIQRSFATAKALMDQFPEYTFMLSQPELYRYLKEEAPEKYGELKQLVKEGRWEPEGAMYLEADCNLTSGESLVRQILHGKRFFREEFGVDSRVLFLPDVFGYSAAMPQILKKSGVDHFVTSKISWNDTNMMPVDAFYWEGIDGTEIFTSFITTQDYGGRSGRSKNNTTYNGKINATQVKGTWDRFQQKEYANRVLMTYGYGDGGGGPTKEMLEVQRRLAKGLPGMPVTEMGLLRPHLEQLKSEFDANCTRTSRVPRWVGELYLEYHRGTYTSVAKNKLGNRRSEQLLGTAEAISATDLYFGGTYDADGLDQAWKKVLHNQFHDILPGSSIGQVYDGTDVDYAEISAYGKSVLKQALSSLAARIESEGGTLVYNPTGFARRDGFLTKNGYCEPPEEIPALGWRVLSHLKTESSVEIHGMTAENPYYILRMGQNGQILSLYDKRVEREVFRNGRPGNVLTVYDDHPIRYDAWEISDYYKLKKWELNEDVAVTPVFDGSRAGFRVEKPYLHSHIVQTVWLYSQNPRIDVETEIDWQERHQLLKASFPLNVHAMSATYDIQFGHVTRPTHQNTSWDEAKFETYAHQWVDVSENGYGVALLNDCKYGYSTEGSDLSITLLKGATYPDPKADLGKHRFTYSLLPHVGDFRQGGVIPSAAALNQPLLCSPLQPHTGDLPPYFSLVSCDAPNAVITAVKKAEADDGLVVRLYDAFDCKSKVTLTVPTSYTRAYACDLLENEERELSITEGKVTIPLSNFEIATLKFQK